MFESPPRSYSRRASGGSLPWSPGTFWSTFQTLWQGKRLQKPTKTERLEIQNIDETSLFLNETDEALNKKIKDLIKESSRQIPFFENENSINAFIKQKFLYDIPNTKSYLRYYIYKTKRL